jgi:hypothetical protein
MKKTVAFFVYFLLLSFAILAQEFEIKWGEVIGQTSEDHIDRILRIDDKNVYYSREKAI